MQLKVSQPSHILFILTLDIEIVRQTHVLQPKIYQNDCLRLFRCVIDHSFIISDNNKFFQKQVILGTCQLYEEKFGEK
jgi:hypothetical protein